MSEDSSNTLQQRLAVAAAFHVTVLMCQRLQFQFSFLLMYPERQQSIAKCLGPCQPGGRPGWSFTLLASTWPRSSCCWGTKQQLEDLSTSLSLLSLSLTFKYINNLAKALESRWVTPLLGHSMILSTPTAQYHSKVTPQRMPVTALPMALSSACQD